MAGGTRASSAAAASRSAQAEAAAASARTARASAAEARASAAAAAARARRSASRSSGSLSAAAWEAVSRKAAASSGASTGLLVAASCIHGGWSGQVCHTRILWYDATTLCMVSIGSETSKSLQHCQTERERCTRWASGPRAWPRAAPRHNKPLARAPAPFARVC
jgi:hypothetical protein